MVVCISYMHDYPINTAFHEYDMYAKFLFIPVLTTDLSRSLIYDLKATDMSKIVTMVISLVLTIDGE